MKNVKAWSVGLVGGIALFISGCGDSATTSTDMAQSPVPICVPNEKSCINAQTAVICTSDGLSRVPVQCAIGQKCDAGECKADANAACTSADDGCMDATTALRCSATASGFDVVTCPAGTACVAGGLCQGACVVGSSMCLESGSVATCVDGKTYTSTACAAGESCVATSESPYPKAACKPSECQPDANGCDFVCGNKATPTAAGQDKTLSTCIPTSDGYKWVAIQCTGAKSCNPSASACSNGPGVSAACTEECHPGDSRCSGFLGYQTCGDNGKWAATITACNANAGAGAYVCMPKQGVPNQVVCGDIACMDGVGACDNTGNFHACGADGRVAATGAACASGVCVVSSGGAPGQWQAGACVSLCQAGDERCVNGSTYQTCVAGNWSAPTQCAASAQCQSTTTALGRPAKVCGECIPGNHSCGGTAGKQLRTCAANATWGAFTDCTAGACVSPPGGSDSVCIAECFPGKKVCLGAGVTVPGVGVNATNSDGTCTAEGKLPAPSACAADTYCRRGPATNGNNGTPLGCVACVGTANEFGIRDSKCADDAGTGAGNYLTLCLANSSGWDGANNTQCAAPTQACAAPSTGVSIPPVGGTYCHDIGGPIGLATESNLVKYCQNAPCPPVGPAGYCADLLGGGPVSCATATGSTVTDCCSNFCQIDQSPVPASCEAP